MPDTDAVHARGCPGGDRPSQVMEGYRYCPGCKRMIKVSDDENERLLRELL